MEPISALLILIGAFGAIGAGAAANASGQASTHSKTVSKYVKHGRNAGKNR